MGKNSLLWAGLHPLANYWQCEQINLYNFHFLSLPTFFLSFWDVCLFVIRVSRHTDNCLHRYEIGIAILSKMKLLRPTPASS